MCNRIICIIPSNNIDAKCNYINLLFAINKNPSINSTDWLTCLSLYFLQIIDHHRYNVKDSDSLLKQFEESYEKWQNLSIAKDPFELLCDYFIEFYYMRTNKMDIELIKASQDFFNNPSFIIRYMICISSIGLPVKESFIDNCRKKISETSMEWDVEMEYDNYFFIRDNYYGVKLASLSWFRHV